MDEYDYHSTLQGFVHVYARANAANKMINENEMRRCKPMLGCHICQSSTGQTENETNVICRSSTALIENSCVKNGNGVTSWYPSSAVCMSDMLQILYLPVQAFLPRWIIPIFCWWNSPSITTQEKKATLFEETHPLLCARKCLQLQGTLERGSLSAI